MTEQHGRRTQIALFFDPKLDPIKDNVKSFVVLRSLMDSEKPVSLDELKKTCSEKYKIDLACEELSDIIDKRHACFDMNKEGITLTEQGMELMHSVEKRSERIQNDGFDWFKDEMSKSVDREKIKNNEDKLKHFFMKCVYRASEVDVLLLKGVGGIADRALLDATGCIKRLNKAHDFTKFDEDIKKSFFFAIRKLFEAPSDEKINRFMYTLQYTLLIRFVLPHGEIIELLKRDLANKKFCLDSNTILSAMFHEDHYHYLIYDIFSKLKQFSEGNLPIFWHDDTAESVMHVLEASKGFCENMEFFPEESISNICMVASKSPVREYFKENWSDWGSFEKYYLDRYRQLKHQDTATKKNNKIEIEIDKKLLGNTQNFLKMYLNARGRMKSNIELVHDSQLLVWVHLLRQSDTSEHITPNYWIVTMDNFLIDFEKRFRKQLFSSEEYPLCVSKRALHLLLDPYFMARSTKVEETFDRIGLGISASMEGFDVGPFYTIKKLNEIFNSRLNEQIQLIGQYLDAANLRDATLSYEEIK